MKKLFIFFAVIILSAGLVIRNSSNPENIIFQLTQKSDIRPGELKYKVYLFGIMPVGEAVLALENQEKFNGQDVYHLRAVAKSLKLFSKFFNGSAAMDSYIDKEDFNPVLFKQRVIFSGKPDMEREITYDQKNGIMTMAGVRRQILPNTQDPLSMLFNLRRMDFDRVKELEININTNQKNYLLKGTITKQDVSIKQKVFNIVLIKAQIARMDKNPYHKSQVDIVFLKDKENIPILIKVFASGMLINAKLVDIK